MFGLIKSFTTCTTCVGRSHLQFLKQSFRQDIYSTEKTQNNCKADTSTPLYERASLGGCLLLTINYDAFFFLLQVCVPASVMQFTQEISRKCNRCHVKDLRLIIVRFSNCRKNFTEFKVGWGVLRPQAPHSDGHPRYVV